MSDKGKVLILSGSPNQAAGIVKILTSLGFAKPLVVENGIEGINLLIKKKFELVVCNIDLKLLNGWLAVKEIKASEKISNVPIMLFGKKDFPGDPKNLEEYGIIKYLKMPVSSSAFEFTLNSTMSIFKTSGTIERKYTDAKEALIQEKSEEAIEKYCELQNLTTKSSRSSIGLIHAYEQDEQEDKAHEVMEELAESGKGTPSSQIQAVKLYCKKGDFQKAKAIADELLKVDPGPFYFAKLIMTLREYHQVTEAAEYSQTALSKNYQMPDFYVAIADYLLSESLADDGLKMLHQCHEKFGASSESLQIEGALLQSKKAYPEALKCFEGALKMSLKNPNIYYKLAICNLDMNEPLMAIHYLESALKLSPEFDLAKNKLAEVQLRVAQ